MTELPAGFVLERQNPTLRGETIASTPLPPGFVLEGEQPPEEEQTTIDFIREAVVSGASGASFGTVDEMAAFGRSTYDLATGDITQDQFSDRYDQVLGVMRERQKGIDPSIAIPSEIAGGLATAVAAAPAVAATVPARVAAVAKQLPGWMKAAGLGGAFGGAYGFGTSEGGVEERAKGAASGGGLGVLTGGALYPVARGVQYGVGKVGTAIKARVAPESTARTKVAQAIERDEMTPGKIRSRLSELGPQATIADAGGRNVRALAGDVARTPGPAQNRAEIILTQRAEGEQARIAQAVKRGLDPQDYYAAEDAFLNNLRARSAPLYEKAYAQHQSLTSRALERLLNSKTGQKALKEAADIIENERASGAASYIGKVDDEITAAARQAVGVGKSLKRGEKQIDLLTPRGRPKATRKVGQPGVTKGLSLQAWDQIKRGFDALLDSSAYRNEITGKLNTRGHSVNLMRRRLLKELDKLTGGEKGNYSRARATYSGDVEVLSALREGRNMWKMDPEQITRYMAKLSNAGEESFRSGAARAILDVSGKAVDAGSAAGRIFNNSVKRAQIRAVFPDQKSYNLLRKTLVAEQKFTKLQRETLGGSQTQPRQVQHEDALTKLGGMAGVMSAGVGPGHTLLKAGIFRKIGQSLLGGDVSPHNLAMAKMLINRNQAMNQHVLDTIFDPSVWRGMPEVARKELGRALLLGAGQQAGRMGAQTP